MAIQNSEHSEHCNFHGAPKHNVLIEDATNYQGANKQPDKALTEDDHTAMLTAVPVPKP